MAAVLTNEIATNLEEVAAATRGIDTRAIGFFSGGMGVGFVVGFIFGYRFNREKIKAEAFHESEKEVEKIRDMYQQRIVAAQPKPSVEEVVEERGYSTVVKEEEERPLPPPVPVKPSTPTVHLPPRTKSPMRDWDYDAELLGRTPGEPYIIHQDERNEHPEYNYVVYTYWQKDDVLTDEDNRPLPNAQEIVGAENLKFGHGSDDEDVVFVRNEHLELDMEICQIPRSYEEDILGMEPEPEENSNLEHSAHPRQRPNRKRKRRR